MSVLLITGPHQSGKSHGLWRRLRAEPLGQAVLLTPTGGGRALVRQTVAWNGPGLLPPVLSLTELVDQLAATAGDDTAALSTSQAAHLLAPWCRAHLTDTPWAEVSSFPATARELAELCRRLDAAQIADDDLVAAARSAADDARFAGEVAAIVAARRHLTAAAARHGLATAGARLARLVVQAALPWSVLYADDLISLDAVELALLASVARDRRLVIAAVDDPRLGDGALVHRLRRLFPDAVEERLGACHPASGHAAGPRALLADALRGETVLPADGVGRYRYRDPIHAGRAIAAWLRGAGVAPGEATLYLRAADSDGLAVADALAGADVPVVGSFRVPWASTAGGGRFFALAAWCRLPDWVNFCALCARLAGAGDETGPPEPLADLIEPFRNERPAAVLVRLRAAMVDGAIGAHWRWDEAERSRPRLAALVAWLESWYLRLTLPGDHWSERLHAGCAIIDCGEPAATVLAQLAAIERLGTPDALLVAEQMAAQTVDVRRGDGLDPAHALLVVDAVRGRSDPRPVAILHGLEHGRWPVAVRRPGLFDGAARRRLAVQLGPDRDPFDEAGQRSGEVAAFLAVVARGTRQVVLGIPCGDRQPSPWLVAIAGQLGWDSERLRADADGEAVAGAPLSPDDSQGGHEHALWGVPRQSISFAFRAPPQPLDLRPSQLGMLLADPFLLYAERLGLPGPLHDDRHLRLGREVHAILHAVVAAHPTDAPRWADAAEQPLHEWVLSESDPLHRLRRARLVVAIGEALSAEAALCPPGTRAATEEPIACAIDVAPGQRWTATGTIDRLDRLPDGGCRVVDYKLGNVVSHWQAIQADRDGQLPAYLHALGPAVVAGHYRGLRDGGMAGYRTAAASWQGKRELDLTDELPRRIAALAQALADWSAGALVTGPDRHAAASPLAPVARLDEARLDLGDGPADDGDDD